MSTTFRQASTIARAFVPAALALSFPIAIHAQKAATTSRPPTVSTPTNFDLASNGEPIDFSGFAGLRITANGALLFTDTKPVSIQLAEGRSLNTRFIARGGAGPGEYRTAPSFVGYRGDSIVAYDAALQRWSVLSPAGAFVRVLATGLEANAISQKAAWVAPGAIVYNASIEGIPAPLTESIVQVVAQLNSDSRNVRGVVVRQGNNGDLWAAPAFSSNSWTVFDRAGRKRATHAFPTPFRMEFANDTMAIGATIDADDAPQIMKLALRKTNASPIKSVASPAALTEAELKNAQAPLIALLRKMVGKQEGNYSKQNSYTNTFENLGIDLPDEVTVSIVDASKRGWFGIAMDKRSGATCAMGVGFAVIGWSEAQPYCGK